jgi:hypothetical protein
MKLSKIKMTVLQALSGKKPAFCCLFLFLYSISDFGLFYLFLLPELKTCLVIRPVKNIAFIELEGWKGVIAQLVRALDS